MRAHLRPTARVAAGRAAALAGATAMIDVSDGLGADLWHIAAASDARIKIRGNVVPAAYGATIDEVLGGGDDYELLCTAPAEVVLDGWRRIGSVDDRGADVLLDGEPLAPRGYRHWRTT